MDVEVANSDVMAAVVSNLVAGRLYTFTITAVNSNGSTSIDCGPVRHDVGRYHSVFAGPFILTITCMPMHMGA